MVSKNIRVAICGGGIGGLSLAVVLQKFSKKDIQIDLYEAKDKFAEIGAGLTIWKRTWYIIQALGLDKALGEMAIQPPVEEPTPSFTFRRADLSEGGQDFYKVIAPYGTATVHRSDMLKVLTDSLSTKVGTHLSKRLLGYSQDSSGVITMSFSDGTTAEADVLVGADGLKSVAREVMYRNLANEAKGRDETEAQNMESFIQPTWSGVYAYRALIDAEKLAKIAPGHQAIAQPLLQFGKNKHIVAYPISKGSSVNFVSLVSYPEKAGSKPDGPMMVEASVDEVMRNHEGWEPQVQQLLSCVEKCSRWSVCQNRDIPYFVSGGVALLGDSAHAMTPNLGAGAGQAIEDAYVLGRLLADDSVNVQNVHAALRIYEAVRMPVAKNCADLSRMCGNCYGFNYIPESVREAGVDIGSEEGLKLLSETVYSAWSFNWTGLPEDEWIEAERMLKDPHWQVAREESTARL